MNRLLEKLRALRSDTSGIAIVEFAYALPVLLALGGFGIEAANLTSTHHKVSQAALALADNMSRVGATSALSQQQIRESDVLDGFMGIRRQVGTLRLTQRGRVILSSMQRNGDGGQWIAWQRCVGQKNVASLYGNQGTGATGTGLTGMGPASARVAAPPNSAVMYVEIVYDYENLFGTMFLSPQILRSEASYIVRDSRDLTGGPDGNGMYNPAPVIPTAQKATCNYFTA